MDNQSLAEKYQRAMQLHRAGNLLEARKIYRSILAEDGTRAPSDQEIALAFRFLPRLFTTVTEPFPLKDFAVVMHPRLPLLGYHMFWDADIEFPAGNDSCDHEVVWVLLDDKKERVLNVFTFFHGTILASSEGAVDAHRGDGRPRIFIQWGKHGSLPYGWSQLGDGQVLAYMKSTYERLIQEGCRDADHPLARDWPSRYEGSWESFVDFCVLVDPRPLLENRRMIMVGERATAIIAVYFLRYCFAVKESWPELDRSGAGILSR